MTNSNSRIYENSTDSTQFDTRLSGFAANNRLHTNKRMSIAETYLRSSSDAPLYFQSKHAVAETKSSPTATTRARRCMSYHQVETVVLDRLCQMATDAKDCSAFAKSPSRWCENGNQTQENELGNIISMEQDADFVVIKVSSRFTVDKSAHDISSITIKMTHHVDYEWGPATGSGIVVKTTDIKINRDGERTESVRPVMHINASQLKRYFPSPY